MNQISPRPPMGQKRPPLVSTKARQNARGKPCSLRLSCCNGDPSTTVLAHLRIFSWAGMGQKPHDALAVYACSDCHDAADGRRNDVPVGNDDLLLALGRTLMEQFGDGVWK
jgi:hypothetical protein